MRSLDPFPLILFGGVCRPASIDLCDPQWLSRKGCSDCLWLCMWREAQSLSHYFQESSFPQCVLRKLQGTPLLAADSEAYYRTLWSLTKPHLLGRWYVDVGKA